MAVGTRPERLCSTSPRRGAGWGAGADRVYMGCSPKMLARLGLALGGGLSGQGS